VARLLKQKESSFDQATIYRVSVAAAPLAAWVSGGAAVPTLAAHHALMCATERHQRCTPSGAALQYGCGAYTRQ
jgi:hypothetical protein